MGAFQSQIVFVKKAAWSLRNQGLSGARRYLRGKGINIPSASRVRNYFAPTSLKFRNWPIPPANRPTHELTVGVIADEFFRRAYEYEWNAVYLTPSKWKSELDSTKIDFLFVDSAWQMEASEPWQYQILGKSAPSEELVRLVRYCQSAGIPTVFWNREDPPHYDDAIETARLFDWVYTTDANRVPSYMKDLGHKNVGVLPFAAQVAIHNPMALMDGFEVAEKRDVAFAGAYYGNKYPERQAQLETLLSGAIKAGERLKYGLDIFARDMGGGKLYRFPKEFRPNIRGSLTYPQTLSAYRAYRAFINVNSVVDSPTMSSMRLFELPACGTPIISTPTPATTNFFTTDMVAQINTPTQAEFTVRSLATNPDLADRMAYLAQQEIWHKHTYTHRVDQILRDIGMEDAAYCPPRATAMISTNRPGQIRHVLDTLARQRNVEMQALIGTHGFVATSEDQAYARDHNLEIQWVPLDTELSLGACYNRLIDRADGDYIAKIDDDDIYSSNYLFDSLLAARYSRADVVGKHAHYMYLADKNLTVLRFPKWENRFTQFVSGPTILGSANIMKQVRFADITEGEDSDFLRRITQNGGTIYSAQRFGFTQMRQAQKATHTWAIPSEEVIATGRISHWGLPNETEFPLEVPKL